MKKLTMVALAAVVAFSSCQAPYKKIEDGIEYKIIGGGSGETAKQGDFLQFHVGQYYQNDQKKDSLLQDSRTSTGAVFNKLDSAMFGPYFKVLSQLKKGDSAVVRVLTDSAFKQNPMMMPPFMKKGRYIITTVKMINIFKNEEDMNKAKTAEMQRMESVMDAMAAEQIKKDDVVLQEYFKKNNITVQKGTAGTYVQIITPGTGQPVDTSVVVATNYTGRIFPDGKVFDSNTDPQFQHVQPFNVNMTNDPALGSSVIRGWTDGLKLLSKGAKAKFYIPSSLAYGSRGMGAEIPANSILQFDIEVADILDKPTALAKNKQMMAEQQALQKKYIDSISKAQAVDTAAVHK